MGIYSHHFRTLRTGMVLYRFWDDTYVADLQTTLARFGPCIGIRRVVSWRRETSKSMSFLGKNSLILVNIVDW